MPRELCLYRVKRMPCNPQRDHHLPARLFALAFLFPHGATPTAAQRPLPAPRKPPAAARSLSGSAGVRACSRFRSAMTLRFNPGGAGLRSSACRSSCSNSSNGSRSTPLPLHTYKLFQLALRLGPQQLESPLQLAFHGRQRSIQRCRNLLRRQILLVPQYQRGPLRFRQRCQHLFKARAEWRLLLFSARAVPFLNLDPQIRAPYPPPAQRIRTRLIVTRRSQKQTCDGDSILPRCRSSSRNTSCAISSARPRSPVIRAASENTMDWCSSTSCSKSGCQSWAISFAATLLSAKIRARGCREYAIGQKKFAGARVASASLPARQTPTMFRLYIHICELYIYTLD
jgi:hypothetical protein